MRCGTIYPAEGANLSPEMLYWLATVPNGGARAIGPEEVVEAVRAYYSNVSRSIADNWLTPNSKQAAKRQLKNS